MKVLVVFHPGSVQDTEARSVFEEAEDSIEKFANSLFLNCLWRHGPYGKGPTDSSQIWNEQRYTIPDKHAEAFLTFLGKLKKAGSIESFEVLSDV
ncbi:unnamed protein product [marine sediment metagenome]|uniref:Uncharacterized protein n=1 Tax=marine sediment metagenome TaxID=412755 RepID=X0WBW9_9ZZZZ